MREEPRERVAIPNGSGTYRIPLTGMTFTISGNPPCLFGDIANKIGRIEDVGDLDELQEIVKNYKKGTM